MTEYLNAINSEQNKLEQHQEEQKESKKGKLLKNFVSRIMDKNIKDSYKPPVEYFNFIFALEKLVAILMKQLDIILKSINHNRELVK